ncbi:hypothetical protein Sango_1246300 [Sesamum angolense]|uniref:MULE transposase domain-containing protein n=1 Tax=Sesamum angolense TaxID=2727404 RepID=A0AAE1WR66_9LAMI|nr:hypothetical protein Sango_1246300 [Sesamum angolense]
MHAIKLMDEETFKINLFHPNHSCPQIFDVKNVKTAWLKEKYLQKFKSDPKRCVKGFRVDIINELRVNVSKDQAYRAKRAALKALEGSSEFQYTRLWDYADEIRKTTPSSTILVGTEQTDGDERFSKFYVCFGAMKDGFKAGCRLIIGVDGCHLKGPHGGILLTAVGVDPSNNLFPISYAVVNRECRETWEWFLIVLKHDLNIARQDQFTFMSDKQKGLMQSFDEVFPGAEHRYCVRHLHNNFKQAGFRGSAFKNALWKAAKACTVGEWKLRMQEMKSLSQSAHDWFNDKPATQWSKSHFSEAAVCDMAVYAPAIKPMNHEGMWSESCIIPPLPPNFGRRAGRPTKARRRELDEPTMKHKKREVGVKEPQHPNILPPAQVDNEEDATPEGGITQEEIPPPVVAPQRYKTGPSMFQQLAMSMLISLYNQGCKSENLHQ